MLVGNALYTFLALLIFHFLTHKLNFVSKLFLTIYKEKDLSSGRLASVKSNNCLYLSSQHFKGGLLPISLVCCWALAVVAMFARVKERQKLSSEVSPLVGPDFNLKNTKLKLERSQKVMRTNTGRNYI